MKYWMHGLYLLTIGVILALIIYRPLERVETFEQKGRESESDVIAATEGTSLEQHQAGVEAIDVGANKDNSSVSGETSSYSHDSNDDSVTVDELLAQVSHQQYDELIQERIEHLDAQFEREAMDQDWAIEQQQNLRDLFVVNEELHDVNVASVQCRESLCRVRLNSDDADSLSMIMKIQNSLRQQSWYGENAKTYLKNSDANDYNYTLYTER